MRCERSIPSSGELTNMHYLNLQHALAWRALWDREALWIGEAHHILTPMGQHDLHAEGNNTINHQ